jgi:hypothetical protein
MLVLRDRLSTVSRLTEPIDPKNLRMRPNPTPPMFIRGHHCRRFINPFDHRKFTAEPIGKSGSPRGQEHYGQHEALPTTQACGAFHRWPRPEVFS